MNYYKTAMVLLCRKCDFVFLEDYIRAIDLKMPILFHDSTTNPYKEVGEYWCIRTVPFHLIPSGSKINFINTEQLSVPTKLLEFKMYDIFGVNIYDYSLGNIRIIGKGIHLPYKENTAETAALQMFLKQEKEYDFAVIGTPSAHRTKQIKRLTDKGFKVHHIIGWNAERDKEVGKCKALLNLHYSPNYSLYESIRCERWRFAGMQVYTEECSDEIPSDVQIIDFESPIEQ